ncbi:hypothetical protein B0H13DRAFT_2350160 [Mycena leptocephala]|jgi:hypothetical protein|nr:hypothetical protein B0H13DRAFT_2350160 [Mycena leptocephala]
MTYPLLFSFVSSALPENRSSIAYDGVTLSYDGSKTLTISPKVGGRIGTLNGGDEIVLVPSDNTYEFTHNGDIIAKVNYSSAHASVTITAGAKHSGTGPFIVKTRLGDD